MGGLDARQERITLALYGGVLAALGFLAVAFLLYLQTVLPLLGQLGSLGNDPGPVETIPTAGAAGTASGDPGATTGSGTEGDTGAVSSITVAPAASEPAAPRTQFLLLLAATFPGAAMVGCALCISWRRGLALATGLHACLAALGLAIVAPQTGGLAFVVPLYLLPVVLIPALLLPQRLSPAMAFPLALAVVGLALVPQFGWWMVPFAWVALPIGGAIAAARGLDLAAA